MSHTDTVRRLLAEAGTTYAEQAGIRLADKPAPLYRLLVLSTLVAAPIRADLAVDATRELVDAGAGTPQGMHETTWQQRVDALGRAHYRRYDEQAATALGNAARQLLESHRGDLRRLREDAGHDPDRIREALTGFPRLGPAGAAAFAREAQAVWPELRPALDDKALDGAERLGLPRSAEQLAALVEPDELAPLAAALVRVALDGRLAERVTETVPS
jgi:hypothetical protein